MGGSATALTVPISESIPGNLRESPAERFKLVVGLVYLIDQQNAAFSSATLLAADVALKIRWKKRYRQIRQLADRLGKTFCTLQHLIQGFFQYLGIQQLFTVFPFVDGF